MKDLVDCQRLRLDGVVSACVLPRSYNLCGLLLRQRRVRRIYLYPMSKLVDDTGDCLDNFHLPISDDEIEALEGSLQEARLSVPTTLQARSLLTEDANSKALYYCIRGPSRKYRSDINSFRNVHRSSKILKILSRKLTVEMPLVSPIRI